MSGPRKPSGIAQASWDSHDPPYWCGTDAAWLTGVHHGVSPEHLQAYLNEFTFRFNRRFYPFNAFRSLLGLSVAHESPTYAELYDGEWTHPTTTRGDVG